MAEYHVQLPDGSEYNIQAASDSDAQDAIDGLTQTSGKSLEGLVKNAGSDVKDIALGLGKNIKEGAYDMPKRALETGLEMAAGKNYSDTPSGQQDANIVANAPAALKQMAEPVTHPIDYAYEHPVSQALNIAGAVAPLAAGPAETAAKYAGRFGEGQMGKLHGSTPAQFRQLGGENFGDAMRASYDAGDADLTMGPIARRQGIQERVAQIGNDIGDLRETASQAGPTVPGKEMADAIRAKLSADYSPSGFKFDQLGSLDKELGSISQMQNPTIVDYAQRATDMNKEAVRNKLTQPPGVKTDVANSLAQLNDEAIAKRLPPELNEDYKTLKEEFGDTNPLLPMELRGEGKEMLGKQPDTLFGVAKNIAHAAIGGPKIGAKAGFGAESALKGFANNAAAISGGGILTGLMSRITTNPQSLGKFAQPLLQAAQSGGSQGVAATHFILSHQYPEYNQMVQGDSQDQ